MVNGRTSVLFLVYVICLAPASNYQPRNDGAYHMNQVPFE